MANANKNKGKTFERWIAHDLCNIFNLNFERTPCSGAFTGGKNFWRSSKLSKEQNLMMEGDIIMPIELSHIKIEAKFYQKFSFISLYDSNAIFDSWVTQSEIGDTKKISFVIFKINNNGAFISIHKSHASLFVVPTNYMVYKNQIIFRYDGFFAANKQKLLDLKLVLDASTITDVLSSTN
jgi:hypothetical protein